MKKFVILISFYISLFGVTIDTLKFEGGVSLFGRVGFADVTLKNDFKKNIYKMKIVTYSTGIVKVLSSNRKDTFTSEGIIKNGVYLPKKFTKHVTKNDFDEITTYLIDYENQTVLKTKIKDENKTVSSFDPHQFKIIRTKKNVIEKNKETIDFHKNDFLTLYLNLKNGNLKKGEINYIDMDKKDSVSLINQTLFKVRKNNGDEEYTIQLLYDPKSIFIQKATAVDIFYYGDAYIKKISEKNVIAK